MVGDMRSVPLKRPTNLGRSRHKGFPSTPNRSSENFLTNLTSHLQKPQISKWDNKEFPIVEILGKQEPRHHVSVKNQMGACGNFPKIYCFWASMELMHLSKNVLILQGTQLTVKALISSKVLWGNRLRPLCKGRYWNPYLSCYSVSLTESVTLYYANQNTLSVKRALLTSSLRQHA